LTAKQGGYIHEFKSGGLHVE